MTQEAIPPCDANIKFFKSIGLGMILIGIMTYLAATTRWVDGGTAMIGDWSMRVKNPNALLVVGFMALGVMVLAFSVLFYLQYLHGRRVHTGHIVRSVRLFMLFLGIVLALSLFGALQVTDAYDIGGPELLPQYEMVVFAAWFGMLVVLMIGGTLSLLYLWLKDGPTDE